MIEDALRETFAAHAGQGPQDVAGEHARSRAEAAMQRAGRIRQRRTMSSALAGVLIVALVSLATFQAVTSRSQKTGPALDAAGDLGASQPPVAPEPSSGEFPPTTDSPMPIEMVSGGEIYKEDKTTLHLALPEKSQPESIYKATDGYLVIVALAGASAGTSASASADTSAGASTSPSQQQLLLLDGRGNQKVLLRAVQRIVVSPSGDRVAWLSDRTLAVATRRPGQSTLDDQLQIPAPAQSVPVAFIGANVVLGRSKVDSTGVDGFDLWYPSHSSYVESWDPQVLRILGPRQDGKAVYAQVRGDTNAVCLAVLLPAQPFTVTEQRCGLPEPGSVDGGMSPDGRWLAYPVDGSAQVAVLDLMSGLAGMPKPRLVDLKADCARVFWVGDNSLVVDTNGRFVAIDPRQPGQQETAQGKSDGTVPIEPLRASVS
jgi:hypothetical protein